MSNEVKCFIRKHDKRIESPTQNLIYKIGKNLPKIFVQLIHKCQLMKMWQMSYDFQNGFGDDICLTYEYILCAVHVTNEWLSLK